MHSYEFGGKKYETVAGFGIDMRAGAFALELRTARRRRGFDDGLRGELRGLLLGRANQCR